MHWQLYSQPAMSSAEQSRSRRYQTLDLAYLYLYGYGEIENFRQVNGQPFWCLCFRIDWQLLTLNLSYISTHFFKECILDRKYEWYTLSVGATLGAT